MRTLNPRERRIVAVGILVLAIGLVWLILIGPLVGGFMDREAQRRELRASYLRNEKLIAALPALRVSAEAQRRTDPRFAVAAHSESEALESLKERLQHLSTDEGFAVNATEDLEADAPPGTIMLRADLTLTLTQLYETLRRLESEDAYVVIDNISISADRSFAANRLAPLDVRLELAANWRPSGATR